MNKQDFINILKKPDLLTADLIPQFKEVLEAYPAFQAGHVLLLKSLYESNDVMYDSYLSKIAIYAGNRALLYDYIMDNASTKGLALEEQQANEISEKTEVKAKNPNIKSEYFDAVTISNDYFHSSVLELPSGDDAFNGVHSFAHWLDIMSNRKEKAPIQEPKSGDRKWDLINNFIKDKPALVNTKITAQEKEKLHDLSQKSGDENEEFMTETLARIYIRQKSYDKALQIFKKLSLKYPEKSVYFAGQIKIVEQLKNNEKQ